MLKAAMIGEPPSLDLHWTTTVITQQILYDRIRTLPGVEPVILKPYGWATAVLNTKQGLMTDKRMRQAFLAALDMEPIMAAGFGQPSFYRLDHSVHYKQRPARVRPATRAVLLEYVAGSVTPA